jgi:uncharacterized protein
MSAPLPSGVSIVTLGVRDVAASTAFYERLGFVRSPASQESITFIATAGGLVLSLFGAADLAEDAGVVPRIGDGFRGVTLAINLASREAVDTAHALASGAAELVAPSEVFWGGYRSYVADPDGHAWELACNPYFPVDERGVLALPGV